MSLSRDPRPRRQGGGRSAHYDARRAERGTIGQHAAEWSDAAAHSVFLALHAGCARKGTAIGRFAEEVLASVGLGDARFVARDCRGMCLADRTVALGILRWHAERLAEATTGASCLTLVVLKSFGLGSSSGVRLVDCKTATEATTERLLVARELVALDAKWIAEAAGTSEADKARNAGPAGAAGGPGVTSYVVTQTEEERGFTLPAFDADEIKRQKGVLVQMYNIQSTRAHCMPSLAGMKKIAYWVRNEGCWPDPARVSLESMRREPTDSALLKFRRIVYGVMVVAAGEKVGPTTRHEGACGSKKHGAQWAHGDLLEELLSELGEAADKIPETEMASVVAVMHESLFKSTSRGNESVSLAASQQICKVVDYVSQAKLASAHAMAAANAVHGRGGGGAPKSPAGSKKTKRGSASSTPDKAQRKAGKAERATPTKWPDEEGALGPNGLPRKKGGNPAGASCERRAKGACQFKTCSYSHE
ncbi:hypothetical protein AB1Y20_005055 [Prymnesium parvum]|uniref:C3H1-type domain-containing protein n=1 Tax=Prymnesium parvum TaxID=97485 RepID=A0AB34J5F3_PRYPA